MSEERKHELVLGTHVKQMIAKVREIAPAARIPQVVKTARLAYESLLSEDNLGEHPRGGDVPFVTATEALADRCLASPEETSPLKIAIGLQSLLLGSNDSVRQALARSVFGDEAAGPARTGPAA